MSAPAAGEASSAPPDMSGEVAAEYKDALKELNSSKPQITFLTMLADEYKEHTGAIVTAVVEYAQQCAQVQKLPCLYLVDSIIKNVKGEYVKLFQQKIHHLFAHIFEKASSTHNRKVDERTRRKMYELRQTWNDIFRKSTLYVLDVKVQALDPAWPVTAPTPSSGGAPAAANPSAAQPPRTKPSTIFVNPSLLKSRGLATPGTEAGTLSKELELRELQKRRLPHDKKQGMEKQKPNLMSSSSSSKSSSRPSDAMELNSVTASDTSRATERKTSTSSNNTSSSSSTSSGHTTNTSSSNTSSGGSSSTSTTGGDISSSSTTSAGGSGGGSSSSGRSADRGSGRDQLLRGYKIKKKQADANGRDSAKSSSSNMHKSQSPLTAPPEIRRPPPTAPHAAKAANTVLSGPPSSSTPSVAPTVPATPSRDPRAPTAVAASSAASVPGSRDPRTWPTRPGEVPHVPPSSHPHAKPHAPSKGPTSSRDPRIANKSRNSSSRSRSRDVAEEASQLFKPDMVTKVPTKIKIDLKVFEASSGKPQSSSSGSTNSDPRFKSRDPRLAAKEEKAKEIASSLVPSSSLEPGTATPPAASSKKEPSSSAAPKDAAKLREKSSERRQEIQRELKKVDRKESRRAEHRSLSPASKKSEKTETVKHRDASSHRNRDRMSDPKSRALDQKKGSSSLDVPPNKPPQTSSVGDNKKLPDSLQSPPNSVKSTPVSGAVSFASTPVSSVGVERVEQPVTVAVTTTTKSIPVTVESSKLPVVPTAEAEETKGLPDDSSAAAQDAFRNVDRSASRRRNLRKRTTPSPEPTDVSSSSPRLALTSAEEETKQAREDGTDSDESDHYEANKPKPLVYSEKKGASASGDVDLRLLGTGAPGKAMPSDATPAAAAASGPVDDLFGSTDVDLRKITEPLQALPAAFQEAASGGATAPREDQDLRKPAPAMPKQEAPSASANEEDLDEPEILIVDQKTLPSNWVKFREKNPEFKQYQRKCITPSLYDFGASPLPYSQARARQVKKSLQDEEDSESNLPGADRLKVIITQAEEELRQGQISIAAYNNTLQQVLAVYEREKMMQAQARDRSCSPAAAIRDPLDMPPRDRPLDGTLLPPPPLPPHLRGPLDKRGPLPMPPRPEFGRGGFRRDHGPVRGPFGPEFSGLHDEWTGEPDLPTVPENILRQVVRDSETRTIDIDGRPREIRTYGSTAILLMDSFDPRTVAFENGHCNIVFDGGEFVIPMSTDEDYKEFHIDGETHRVKLGVPTQELFLDDRGYQCFFGGKPITIHLAGRVRTIRLDGRPPTVTIGKETNRDFLLGKISLVVNANTKRMTPLYLDAKPQRIIIDGKVLVLKFVDKFRGVDINSVIHPVSFGGLPTRVSVRQLRKYLSFSSLPPDLVPGEINVIGMDCETIIPNYALLARSRPPLSGPAIPSSFKKGSLQPPPPPPSSLSSFPTRPPAPQPPFTVASDGLLTKPHMGMPAPPPFPNLPIATESKPVLNESKLELKEQLTKIELKEQLTKIELTKIESKPPVSEASNSAVVPGSYNTNEGPSQSPPPPRSATPRKATPSPAPANPASLDVSSLIQTLIKVGIIGNPSTASSSDNAAAAAAAAPAPAAGPTTSTSSAKDRAKDSTKTPNIQVKKIEELKTKPKNQPAIVDPNDEDWMEPEEGAEPKISSVSKMDFLFKSQQLRRRSSPLVAYLHRGMQCSSCGMRYPAEQTMHYSQHLDWHFRQNKREQESTKKANSRKFYIPIDDWMQYEEIEDVDERVPSMFEAENGAAGGGLLRDISRDEDEETEASVPVNSDEPGLGVCPVCRDTFSQFFQHNTDEWHYRNAIARDGVNYHPSCYQDLVKQKEKEEEKAKQAAEEAELEAQKKKKEEEEKARLASECPPDVSASTDAAQPAADAEMADAALPSNNVEAATDKPEPNSSTPQSTETAAGATVPGAATATPATDTASTGTPAADTATPAADTATSAPDTATSAPDTATSAPDTATSAPDTATSAPDTATSAPDTATSASDTATSAPDIATPASDTAPTATPAPDITTAVGTAPTDAAAEAQAADAEPPVSGADTAPAEQAAPDAEPPVAANSVAADSPLPGVEPTAEPKKKKKKKKKKKPVQPIVPAVRIKEEPLDESDIIINPGTLQGVAVKQEKPDEPEIEEQALDEGIEEMEQSAAEDDLSMMIDRTGDLSASRSTLLTSTIDGNVEETEAPDTTPATAPMPRIRLSGALGGLIAKSTANKDADTSDKSFPISVIGDDSNPPPSDGTAPSPTPANENAGGGENETETTSKENGLVAEDEGVEGVQSDDDDIIEWDEFIPPPFTPDLKRHPSFEGAKMIDVGVTRAGLEESSLCSIM